MKKTILIALIATLLSSCQPYAPPTLAWTPDTANGDYGAYPSNYKSLIKGWYLQHAKDPASVKFMGFSRPREENAIKNVTKHEAIFGYSTCAIVNAKNSFGGYTGGQPAWFLIRNGRIVEMLDDFDFPIYIGHPINCEDGPPAPKAK